jgi:hypothetical protein
MAYAYCLDVNILTCGNVPSLVMDVAAANQTVSIVNVVRSDNTSCYWGFQVNDTWVDNPVLYVYVEEMYGFNLSFAGGSTKLKTQTLFRSLTQI